MNSLEKFQRILIVFLVAIGFFYGGYYFGKRGYLFEVRKNPPQIKIINQSPSSQTVDFSLFWKVWDMVGQDYLERPVDPQEMLYGAISGMVNSLGDPYTSFLPPEVNKAIGDAINGSYTGIGAELGLKEGQLIVIAPLDGSPAKAAGIRSGDKILEIEGSSSLGLTVTEAVSKIRGEAGTISTLKLQRAGVDPFVVTIKRGVITIASVKWEDKGDGTAYIRVSRFGGDTNQEWQKVVSQVNTQMDQLDAIIVDVRGNPGGYLQSAFYLGDEFVKKGPILWEEDSLGKQTSLDAERPGSFEAIPAIYVLIDEGSASAAEILAAALKDNVNATLLGVKSFGKGTIQDAKDFEDGSGVHITIAKWLTPKKVWVHGKGIDPDTVVEQTEESITAEQDLVLEKAVELAKKY
ncbi:MAG: hypothetical protein ACD_22C00117G0003 [uncultured bacterium]|nr:MAG: hypothetical protein ACD_22C00117G0003 [uncultured bacterium]